MTYQVKYAEKSLAGENLKNTAIAEPESGDAGKGESTVELVEDAPVLTVKKEAGLMNCTPKVRQYDILK